MCLHLSDNQFQLRIVSQYARKDINQNQEIPPLLIRTDINLFSKEISEISPYLNLYPKLHKNMLGRKI